MVAVNASFDNYGTTSKDSALLESEPPIDSRKSPQPREITPAAVKLGLGDGQETIPAGAPILVDGVREWVSYREPDIDEDDFDEVGAAFEGQDTTTRTGLVGQARCTLLRVRPLVDFAIPWLKRQRNAAD